MRARIAYLCPSCSGENEIELDSDTRCRACGARLELKFSAAMKDLRIVDRCALCGSDRLYIQKDFNRKLGLAIVAAAVLLSYILFGFDLPALVAGLSACVAADYLLYRLLPEVAVCYACSAIYRGFARNPEHKPFDLNVAEEYDGILIAGDGKRETKEHF